MDERARARAGGSRYGEREDLEVIGVNRRRSVTWATIIGAALVLGVLPTGPAIATEEPRYHLPAPEGLELVVSQGNHDRFARTVGRSADERYAFDFITLEGSRRFPVLAARGGTVIGLRDSAFGGACSEPLDGPRPACWRNVNYVLIDHGDGTSGLYQHLRRGEADVRVGHIVSAGQQLGVAGSTGWTDQVGVQFQLQETPARRTQDEPGWFLTRSLPVAFDDPDVRVERADGVPLEDDVVISANPGAAYEPFRLERRPRKLAAAVPLAQGEARSIRRAYDADSSHGYGLHFASGETRSPGDPVSSLGDGATATDPGTDVRPLFGGEVVFAGCATGDRAALGGSVIVERRLSDATYHAVLGNLTRIDPVLLDWDGTEPAPEVVLADVIGSYGSSPDASVAGGIDCPAADPATDDLFAGILRDATVEPDGAISGGTPVALEPLVGERGYEGFAWWSGPLAATDVSSQRGRPRVSWNRRTTAHTANVPYGDPVRLSARVRDSVDIAEVRFRAHYPDWARETLSSQLPSFDPWRTWRELAVCRPDSSPRSGCTWRGNPRDALVTYRWDPTAPDTSSPPWLPRARTAITRSSTSCVPVSLAVEVVDTAGHVARQISSIPPPSRCDQRASERADGSRLVYLDPLAPPRAPAARGNVEVDRGWPAVYRPDPLNGAIVWRDRSNNEDGFTVYARRSWFLPDCSIKDGPWQKVTDLRADKTRYRPRHRQVVQSIRVPDIKNVPGELTRWEYAVAAFNEAGRSRLVPVGGFLGGSEAFCDTGLEPPPDLQ
jgi:hypothetical protein